MAITIIFGESGKGKSSLGTFFLKEIYEKEGDILLRRCRQDIADTNRRLNRNYTLPDRPPLFTTHDVRLHIGYKKFFEPYYINGFYFGLANERMDTMFIPPFSKIWFDEAHKYFNSRKAGSFPAWVSQAFSQQRHFGLDIFLMTTRFMQIDTDIRQTTTRFIEVQGIENKMNFAGVVECSKWKCREWSEWDMVERYLNTKEKTYLETEYVNEGNIFDSYNSFAYKDDFLPSAGKDFSYFSHIMTAEQRKDPGIYKFFAPGEPQEYRGRSDNKK